MVGYVIQVIDSLDVTLVDKTLEKLQNQIAGFFSGYAYDLFISGRYETMVSDSNHRLVTRVHIGRSICANYTRKFHGGMAKITLHVCPCRNLFFAADFLLHLYAAESRYNFMINSYVLGEHE